MFSKAQVERLSILLGRSARRCLRVPLQNRYDDSFPTSPLRPRNLIEVPR